MSELVFPTLKGKGWSVIRRPIWSTRVQTARSGIEYRAANWSYPIWEWEITYELLREYGGNTEFRTLAGFFNQVRGGFDDFLYADDGDYTVTDQSFGTGDGSDTTFQLYRTLGGFTEPVRGLNGTPTVKVAGSTVSPASISTTGLVTFSSAPANGAALTWTGNFYWRVRFGDDMVDFEQFLSRFWMTGGAIRLRSVKA